MTEYEDEQKQKVTFELTLGVPKEDLAETLRYIASLVDKGFTSGYYPTWHIKAEE